MNDNTNTLNGMAGTIVHARYDMNCRVGQAFELHQAWANSKLEIVEDSGHAQDHPGYIDACIRAFQSVAAEL